MIKKLFILVGLARAGGVCAGKISPNARFLHARYPWWFCGHFRGGRRSSSLSWQPPAGRLIHPRLRQVTQLECFVDVERELSYAR